MFHINSYIIKQSPEDFKVCELPDLKIDPVHGLVKVYTLEKKGLSTFDAIDFICKNTNLSKEQICYGGLKDEIGITKQYVSIDKSFQDEIVELKAQENTYIRLEFLGYGEKHISIGHLKGNAFEITLRNCHFSEEKIKRLEKYQPFYYINYYDLQRFGLPNQKPVTHLLGKALTEQNHLEIEKYLRLGGQTLDMEELFLESNREKQCFYRTAWESYLWNQQVGTYLAQECEVRAFQDIHDFTFSFAETPNELAPFIGHSIPYHYYKNKDAMITKVTTKREIVQAVPIQVEVPATHTLLLKFSLKKGQYATMVVKQFMELL